ncbi:MAG: 4-(cytidine 5'-diphospho)-2-C-methyl-D-erythritol kinase [Niastella sp.]|nr:4-(cytidine 5'-diphospho)-2-C-methyl-D-erythritol kinase [Niastella sp.]
MIVFPNCKINLGLHITRKRPDGYHDLETVFYPLPLRDAIEVITSPVSAQGFPLHQGAEDVELFLSGLPVQGTTADNLCVKAWHLLKKDFPQLPPIQLHLHKAIPMGAGLGGGSADAAFTLQLLNNKFRLGLTTEQLLDYSLQLGSDCPFFIINKPCIATGRGELMQAIPLDLSAWSFLLVYPAVHINTGWAFSQITPAPPLQPLSEIIRQPVETWKNTLINDFEAPVCQHHPALQNIKETLYTAGAAYASMTGSGSCFYGIFPKGKVPQDLFPSYKFYILNA